MALLQFLLIWLFIAASTLGAVLGLRFYLHMFQLNSYKPGVQWRWALGHWRKWALLALPAVGGLFLWPRKAKKPLVLTPRVKRMVAAAAVLQLMFLFAGIWAGGFWRIPAAYLMQLASPLLVLLANGINQPMERGIRRYYTKQAMEKLKSSPNLTIIGITGSYGKTSVKYFLNTLLRANYNVLATPGSFNTPMGVVKTIREELSAAHEIFICEMGAKHVGDIKELCEIVQPQHGILTSIGPQHLESFQSLDNVISTKFELADSLPAEGMLFVNGEDENIRSKIDNYRHISYASAPGSSYFAEEISVSERGTTFTIVTPDGQRERCATRLIGRHNVVNLVGAAAAAHSLGVPLQSLKTQMRKLSPVPHRLELIDRGDLLVIDDAYNSNPAGAKAALDTLGLFDGMRIIVTPGMVELGAQQEALNGKLGEQAAQVCDFIALVGAAQTKPIYEGACAAGFAAERIFVEDTLQGAMEKIYGIRTDLRKIVLLENDLPDNY